VIRLREGDHESILTIEEFERLARLGEISPFAEVCLPAMTGERFVQARELPLFTAIYDPRRLLFRRHFHLGRFPVVTGLLALACVALYFVAVKLGDGVVTREALLDLGAKSRARIVDEGEAWRLLTANLLHRDGTHLAFNLFTLLNIGTVLEGVYRRGDYVLLALVGGTTTMAVSTIASAPVTVGASGVVFAYLGAAVVFGLRFSEVLPLRYRLYFGVVVVGYAAVMFYLGLQRATTDNWGHAGGLIAGLIMGALLEPRLMRLREAREPTRVVVVPWILSGVLVLLVFVAGAGLPRVLFDYTPYRLDTFGVEIERPTTWSRSPDPLGFGFLAFGNGVDALASIACGRVAEPPGLDEAGAHFVDTELRSLERGGHIGSLVVGASSDETFGTPERTVPSKRVPFSFLASDGPFKATAWVFVRGEVECAFVLAERENASPRSLEILAEVRKRVHFVETKAQREARNAVLNRPRSVKAQLDLALAAQAAGDVDEARKAFAEASSLIAEDPGYENRVRVGRARFELACFDNGQGGDLEIALVEAERARLYNNGDPDVAVLLIDVLLARKDLERARIAADAALTQFPDDARVNERKKIVRELLETP
jgi:membrane associated rhomboid family serine protease